MSEGMKNMQDDSHPSERLQETTTNQLQNTNGTL